MGKIVVLVCVAAIVACLFCIIGAATVKAAEPLIEIKELHADQLVVEGFELSQRGRIEIDAVGAGKRNSNMVSAYGWIINAEDRETVWSMADEWEDVTRISDAVFECEAAVALPAGKYEVYYYVGKPYSFLSGDMDISIDDLGKLIEVIGDAFAIDAGKPDSLSEEDIDELMMTIRTDVPAKRYTPVFAEPPGSIVFINRPDKDEFHEQGFMLKKEMVLNIYAIGEFSDSYDLFVDGAWIINADTREIVWSMDEWDTDRAGGSSKNRYFRDEITLPAGNYVAYYATDDSHDFGEWNSPPPADLMNYGLSIAAADPANKAYALPYEDKPVQTEIINIDRVGDYASEKTAFTLKRAAKVRIVAMGERGFGGGELVDYGWITDADDLDKVWEMTAENTTFAGGAAKNCRYDGTIDLPAGDYVVHYRTDDSHAYGEWNAAPPFDKHAWGITVYGFGKDFAAADFAVFDKFRPSEKILIDMTGLGDDEDISRSFTITETTKIRIQAMGEGKGNTMYDYGWIENEDTDETVWEMTYRSTRHAGGADKNRLAVANVVLEKGHYTAHFVTDDSHSFAEFNAAPPDDPEQWGMMITER